MRADSQNELALSFCDVTYYKQRSYLLSKDFRLTWDKTDVKIVLLKQVLCLQNIREDVA